MFNHSFIFVFAAVFLLAACTSEEQPSQKYQGDMVLALSWQTAFCETRPRLPECRSQTEKRFDANHFSLHGLWPQPGSNIYCNVDEADIRTDKRRRWKRLEGLGLSDALKKKLWEIMPGARSFLHRHEWIKHGTCYSKSAETYYKDSVLLVDAINASAVRDLFANNVGRSLRNGQIQSAFDDAFGKGAGQRVRVACKRDGSRTLITELTIGFSGKIEETADIAQLIKNAPRTKRGCPVGIVDRAGFQ